MFVDSVKSLVLGCSHCRPLGCSQHQQEQFLYASRKIEHWYERGSARQLRPYVQVAGESDLVLLAGEVGSSVDVVD